MKKGIQVAVQIGFLALFIFLIMTDRTQMWMGLFLLGIIGSFIFGRVYCGWVCSINTVLQGVHWIKKKLHIKSRRIPPFLTKPWVRYLALGLFVAAFLVSMTTGKKLPMLPALFVGSVALTFFFHEELWHRYLCPYGTILRFPATKSAHFVRINPEKCNNCGVCKRVCPAKAVEKNARHHEIAKEDCLICMECIRNCRQDAISYQ